MVLGFAAAGADVVIASRKIDACRELAQEVERTTGRQALAHACHVGKWEQLEDLVSASYDRFGKVDVLVNNAGLSPVYEDLTQVTEALWDKVFDVNLKGAFRLSVLVASRMTEAEGGSIINISSGAAVRPGPSMIPYAAAKAGLNAMTVGLAQAYGPRVRVNAIMSGPFHTDGTKDWGNGTFAPSDYALGRMGNPPEIVGAALYLAGSASSFTTGAILPLDGGMR
jgi:NAD(P)-dependent dehydrogenase (short-subunit alcohol dehydrogenase family)